MAGSTALFAACVTGDAGAVRRMVLGDARSGTTALLLDARNERGQTALHIAARSGHEHVVAALLRAEAADPNTSDKIGATPLHSAAVYGHLSVVRLLLSQGADPAATDAKALTALEWAKREFAPAIVLAALHEAPGLRDASVLLGGSGGDSGSSDEFLSAGEGDETPIPRSGRGGDGRGGGSGGRGLPHTPLTPRVDDVANASVPGSRTTSGSARSGRRLAGGSSGGTGAAREGKREGESYSEFYKRQGRERGIKAGARALARQISAGSSDGGAEDADAAAVAAAAAAGRGGAGGGGGPQQTAADVARQARLAQLLSMGFEEAASLRALESSNGDVGTATEVLLSGVLDD
jgi:hypothetical protein